MSNPYTPTTTSTGQQATAYPYAPYRPSTSGTFGSYQGAASYQTGVTGYGSWPYQYSYIPQLPQSSRTPGSYTPTFSPSVPQRSTFTPYTPPTYTKDTATAAPTVGPTRTTRKQQSNFKGTFTKERMCAK
jgi:transcription initiation factor TFIID subunit 13